MSKRMQEPEDAGRRTWVGRAFGLVAAATAIPAVGLSVPPRRLSLRMEGDVPSLEWVRSLYMPPVLAAGLPPGTTARFRVAYPVPAFSARDPSLAGLMSVTAFLAPVGIPPGVAAPELAVITDLAIEIDSVLLGIGAFADPATRPAMNAAMMGRIVTNDVESPFGFLVGRVATTSFGFEWIDGDDAAAVFRLVTISAAGSHVSTMPEAAGKLDLGRVPPPGRGLDLPR
jgi:hypothetical protein